MRDGLPASSPTPTPTTASTLLAARARPSRPPRSPRPALPCELVRSGSPASRWASVVRPHRGSILSCWGDTMASAAAVEIRCRLCSCGSRLSIIRSQDSRPGGHGFPLLL